MGSEMWVMHNKHDPRMECMLQLCLYNDLNLLEVHVHARARSSCSMFSFAMKPWACRSSITSHPVVTAV